LLFLASHQQSLHFHFNSNLVSLLHPSTSTSASNKQTRPPNKSILIPIIESYIGSCLSLYLTKRYTGQEAHQAASPTQAAQREAAQTRWDIRCTNGREDGIHAQLRLLDLYKTTRQEWQLRNWGRIEWRVGRPGFPLAAEEGRW
jgi:hypothetical protein